MKNSLVPFRGAGARRKITNVTARARYLLCSVALTMSLSAFSAEPREISVCFEDAESYPWLLHDRPGLLTSLMQAVERKTGIKLTMESIPWKRCVHEVTVGNIDALIKISFSPARAAEVGVYPMKDGAPDVSLRLLMDSYSIYRLKGSPVTWDGKVLSSPDLVGAQAGFSIVEQLKALGVDVEDGTRSAEQVMQKLVMGRVGAAALQTQQGDALLRENPEAREKVEKLSPFLVEKPYFLIFSKAFYSKHPESARVLWSAIGSTRESSQYKKLVKAFK